ncbi:glycosyltransferase [Pontibacter qinzhouensis]|uniref:Glycosyltransferase n=1 Tax=Pontibacter qinzhouensis TaxID=2603253 RepID=A0A5C8IQM0_9BACT|nr:glycosyltransferase [Pontibacter qinzhouensis]TXK23336.1 glycosyltransferase [Pontibacter qinzhouensis]
MNRIPTSPPAIAPLPEEGPRPLWSVMIPVYNCAHFLHDALQSVLMQGIPEQDMQIEVIDDASTDADVEEIVKRIGKGRIKYYRQPENVGSLRNFETCINRAKGELVHLLHGDDRIRKGYYKKINQLFKQNPGVGAAFCRFSYMDEKGEIDYVQPFEMKQDGVLSNWLIRIAERQRIQYVSIVVRREVYEKLGSFFGITYGEDWEMWVRIAKHYSVAYTPEVLADYRKHDNSISGQKFMNGQYLMDIAHAMQQIQEHLPEVQRKAVMERSRAAFAHYGISVANGIWHATHDKQNVQEHIKHTLVLHHGGIRLYLKILKVYLKMITNRV